MSRWSKLGTFALAAALAGLSALLLGRWAHGRLLDRAAGVARAIAESTRDESGVAAGEATAGDAEAPSGLEDRPENAAVGHGRAGGAVPVHRAPRVGRPPPSQAISIGEEQVLAWARAETVPRARWRVADALPAGLEIDGGQAFVAELDPGDRLIAVDGAAVADREEVVRRVLEARGRGQSSIAATFVRLTPKGPARFVVTIQQPYVVP